MYCKSFDLRSLFVILGLMLLAGCSGFGDVRSIADRGLEEEGMVQASAVWSERTPKGMEIRSYGRSGGEREIMVEPGALEEVAVLRSTWGTLTLSVVPEERSMVEQALWTEEEQEFQELLDVAKDTMHGLISALPILSRHGVNVQVLLTTYDSGLTIEERHLVDEQAITLGLISPVVESDGEPSYANPNISMMTTRVVSVLLRAEYALDGRRYGTVNEVAAKKLFERCAQSRFAVATGVSVTARYKYDSWSGFPGLADGEWAPRVNDFPFRNPEDRGQYVAAAMLFHATGGVVPLDLSDAEVVAPLFELCDRLGTDLPNFVGGETGSSS